MEFLTDIEIAQSCQMKPIQEIAKKLQIDTEDVELFGKYKAKLPLHYIQPEKINDSNLILVTAINPTPAGEGKTTVTIGLHDAMCSIGKKSIAVIREPSLGPVFGLKGGAAGGGYAQVVPMEDINLHFTGDFSAIEKANNLLSAIIDNYLQFPTDQIDLDPKSIVWKRVMDMNDRALRNVIIGLGAKTDGVMREEGFNITPASEIMAILCLSESLSDLKNRLGNIFVGYTKDKKTVFARDLKAENAMTILLKDAIKPNLVQTLEGNPVLVHGGPFANIAQGTNSVLATKMGMSLGDYVITEAGFGADLGAEKFLDIKCVSANLKPKAIVLVATIRALRHHGGAKKEDYNIASVERVSNGFSNLKKHIENAFQFGFEPVIAINKFFSDSQEEIDWVIAKCAELNVKAVVSEGFEKGGAGAKELAEVVVETIEKNTSNFQAIYDWNDTIENKIQLIASKIYGASEVEFSGKAMQQIAIYKTLGFEHFPICMAKTQKSLSDDETRVGAPKDFTIHVREFEIAVGAKFIIPIVGNMMRMPGLPKVPAALNMFIDDEGKISGLS